MTEQMNNRSIDCEQYKSTSFLEYSKKEANPKGLASFLGFCYV